MLNTLTKTDYYRPTNQREGCWWKALPLSNVYKRDLFLSGPNSLMVFEREMDVRFGKMIDEIEKPIRERLRQGECQEVEGGNGNVEHMECGGQ